MAGNGVSRRVLAMAAKTVTIRTKPTPVEFGQSISIVSNVNSWETSTATTLSWTEGDVWQGELEVPGDVNLEFKLVKMANGEVIEWEEGENKSFVVSGKGSKMLECSWGSNELTETKARKRSSSSSKKKKEEEDIAVESAVVVESAVAVESAPVETAPVETAPVETAPVEQTPATAAAEPDAFDHVTASVSGDEIMYTFDEEDYGESAADIAQRIYGS